MNQAPAKLRGGEYVRDFGLPTGKDGVIPRFWIEPTLNEHATQLAGREIWDDVEMVEMLMPGVMLTRPTAKVTDEHRNRWPEHYAAFKRNETVSVDGRPLEEWPLLSRGMVRELKHMGFQTVEQLAEMGEQAIQRIGMGARDIKAAAQAFVNDVAATAPIRSLQAENDRLKSQLAAQDLQLQNMNQQLQGMNDRLMQLASQPHPVATAIPAHFDPTQAALYAAAAPGGTAAAAPAGSLSRFKGRPRPESAPAAEPAPAATKPRGSQKKAAGAAQAA